MEPLPLEEVRPPVDEAEEEVSPDDEDELVPLVSLLPVPVLPLDPVLLFVVEDTAPVSVCIVPISANIPAAAASVTAAAVAAVRRVPLRTAARAPRSLLVMSFPPW
ncbi:hypothetical protein ACWCQ1_10530 [Streptomyces sp. NPDC002144]